MSPVDTFFSLIDSPALKGENRQKYIRIVKLLGFMDDFDKSYVKLFQIKVSVIEFSNFCL